MAGQPNTRKKPPLVLSTSDVMVTSYVSVFLPAVQQLALEPLLGKYPKSSHSFPASQPTVCPGRLDHRPGLHRWLVGPSHTEVGWSCNTKAPLSERNSRSYRSGENPKWAK